MATAQVVECHALVESRLVELDGAGGWGARRWEDGGGGDAVDAAEPHDCHRICAQRGRIIFNCARYII